MARGVGPATGRRAGTGAGAPRERYTETHARSGIDAKLPAIDTWPNQFPGYEIAIENPEYTAVCPKTGLPDFGEIYLRYAPRGRCAELKSLKEYFLAYRQLGIFYENAVNRILRDFVRATRPDWAEVRGEFTARGGMRSVVVARYGRVPAAGAGAGGRPKRSA